MTFLSPIDEISKLRMSPLRRKRSRKCEAIIATSRGVVARLKGGKWWCVYLRHDRTYNVYNDQVDEILEALVELEVLSQEAFDAHLKHCKRRRDEYQAKQDARELSRIAKRHSFKFTRLPEALRKHVKRT